MTNSLTGTSQAFTLIPISSMKFLWLFIYVLSLVKLELVILWVSYIEIIQELITIQIIEWVNGTFHETIQDQDLPFKKIE